MRLQRAASSAAACTAVALTLASCGSDYPLGEAQRKAAEENNSNLRGTLTGVGSSAQGPAMDAWRGGFSLIHPKVQMQYSPAGSGAGRTTFLAGGAEFAGSDAFLQEKELDKAREVCGPGGAFDIPAYISPIAVAFNLPGISELNLDAATIARIFRGEISTWNDPAIAALNPEVPLPAMRLTPVNRSDNSGTTENFTEYLHAAAPAVWTDEPDGAWPGVLSGENAQGNSGVVSIVTRTEGAVTYADDSVVGDSLGKVRLQVGSGFVGVSAEAASAAVREAERVPGRGEHDIALELDRTTTAAGVYPLVLVSYHIYCSNYPDAATAELVRTFGLYVMSPEGQEASSLAAKSAPVPTDLAADAARALESITGG